jgi:galactokinase
MTGAGFGGSAVALVESAAVADFVAAALEAFGAAGGAGAAYPSRPAAGVQCLPWRER